MTPLDVFFAGLAYEYMGTLWALTATRKHPHKAAMYAAGCAIMTVIGVGGALHSVLGTVALAAGYAVGTWLGVLHGP